MIGFNERGPFLGERACPTQLLTARLSFLREQVPFYRDRYPQIGSFAGVPLTFEKDVATDSTAFLADGAVPLRVSVSGGTGGHPKLLFRTSSDLEHSATVAERMFRRTGVKHGDTVIVAQPFDLWNIGHIALRAFESIGALSIPAGLTTSDDALLDLMRTHSATVLYSTPSRTMNLLRKAAETGIVLSLRRILCAGEPILPRHREEVSARGGLEIFGIYGSEETDGIGSECVLHAGYHLDLDHAVIEILDPDSLEPFESATEHLVGAVSITPLHSEGTVLARYVLGDVWKIESERCPCGDTRPVFSILGRLRDTLWLYDGLKLGVSEVQDVLASVFGGPAPLSQIILTGRLDSEALTILVEHPDAEVEHHASEARDALWAATTEMVALKEAQGPLPQQHQLSINIMSTDRKPFVTTARGKVPPVLDRRRR